LRRRREEEIKRTKGRKRRRTVLQLNLEFAIPSTSSDIKPHRRIVSEIQLCPYESSQCVQSGCSCERTRERRDVQSLCRAFRTLFAPILHPGPSFDLRDEVQLSARMLGYSLSIDTPLVQPRQEEARGNEQGHLQPTPSFLSLSSSVSSLQTRSVPNRGAEEPSKLKVGLTIETPLERLDLASSYVSFEA